MGKKGKDVLTTGEAAEVCNLTRAVITKLFDKGLLKGHRVGLRQDRLINTQSFFEFLEKNNLSHRTTL